MAPRPRILVTNDDGVLAPGIIALACSLAPIGEVRVVAPDRPRSGAGHSITLHKPLRMEPVALREYQQAGVIAWGTTGTPSDCVILALSEVYPGEHPDLVVSGINSGPNVGDDVTYSGTVSAGMEASLMGIPAMACSMGWFGNHFYYWDAARAVRAVVEQWAASPPAGRLLWNINLPNIPLADYDGLMFTRLGHRTFKDQIAKRIDPKGQPYYWIAGDKYEEDLREGTDTWALQQHLVSITPLTMDMTNTAQLVQLDTSTEAFAGRLASIEGYESPGPDAGEIPYVGFGIKDGE